MSEAFHSDCTSCVFCCTMHEKLGLSNAFFYDCRRNAHFNPTTSLVTVL